MSKSLPWILPVLATLWLAPLAGTAHAAGNQCFRLGSKGPAGGSQQVELATPITWHDRCEYALDAAGPWAKLSGAQSQTYVELVSALLTATKVTADTLPTNLFGRTVPTAAQQGKSKAQQAGPVVSIFLAGCSKYLLSPGQGFQMSVPVGTQRPTVTRDKQQARCGAGAIALGFLSAPTEGQAPLLKAGPWSLQLATGEATRELDPGHWIVYAVTGDTALGLRVGEIDTGSSSTPLRQAFDAMGKPGAKTDPWLRATWAAGRLRLEPTSDALQQSDRWAELRTAAAANLLWLARDAEDSSSQQILGKLVLDRGGRAIALPSSELTRHMASSFGDDANHMVPTMGDWQGVLARLQVCLAPRYQPTQLQMVGGPVPEGASCVELPMFLSPLAVRGGAPLPTGQICLRRHLHAMTLEGPESVAVLGEQCAPLDEGPDGASKLLLAAVGDELIHAGTKSEGLFLCVDNRCQPLAQAGTWMRMDTPGLLEIRYSDRLERATTADGLTLLRLGIVDPATQWHPLGLYRTSDGPVPPNRWTQLDSDAGGTFSFVRGQQQLRFRLSASSQLVTAFNRSTAGERLGQALPLVSAMAGTIDAPPASALVTLVTREGACPTETAAEVQQGDVLVDPNGLLSDQTFHVYLAQYEGQDQPYRCLARASMHVTDSLTVPVAERLRVGLLGDTQLALFMTGPAAVGAILPVAYGQWRLVYGFGLDVSASLTAAAAFDGAQLTRAGAGLGASAFWGPERYAPRLVSVGVMLHGASGTHPDKPIASLYMALNLSTLVDLAGGR